MSLPPPSPTANSSFSPDRLARLGEIERWHFWFIGRQTLVKQFLEKYLSGGVSLLDIGCGTGWMMEQLIRQGYQVTGLDFRLEGLQATRERLSKALLIQADATYLPIAEAAFNGIILLDVLEHVNDVLLLKQANHLLKPGGIAVISVPALPWLWSYRDVAAGHRRRYTRRHFRQLLAESGFKIMEIRYYQCLLLPITILARILGREDSRLRDLEDRPSPVLNKTLAGINRIEVKLGNFIAWPWGSSLLTVCKK